MGLDMYIKRTNRTDHTIEELEAIDDNWDINPESEEVAPFLPLREYEYSKGAYSIFHEEAYWRKFNALHNWFVERVQDGIDKCQTSELHKETFVELLNDIQSVLGGEVVEDLEPVSGFFFGSTEKDEWYFESMRKAKEKIESLIKNTDFEKYRLFYHASW